MHRKVILAVAITGFLVISWPVVAKTIHVPGDQPTIQDGIDAAVDGDTVFVAAGTYFENINFNGKGVVVKSEHGWTQTIIDGQGDGIVVRFESGEDSTSILEGFTIQGGNADFSGFAGGGGLLCCNSSSPVINECDINNNYAGVVGGGTVCRDSSAPRFVDCIIRNNSGGSSHFGMGGGGVGCLEKSNPTFQNCRIAHNRSWGTWGGVGGAILCDNSFIDLGNCVISQNEDFFPGVICCQNNSVASFHNCTIAYNTSIGLFLKEGSNAILTNSIVWGNTEGGVFGSSERVDISYCDIQEEREGIGNISADPLFVDPHNGDFHLQCASPCINAGDPESPFDPDSTRADMGAFYYDLNDHDIKGDVNSDCRINILDVANVVCIVLNTCEYDEGMFYRADWNGDDQVNILDVVGLIHYILEGQSDTTYVYFRDVEDYGNFCVTEKGTFVITSDAEWISLWELYWSVYDAKGNKTPPPEVPFEEEMVIGIFWGGGCVYSGCTNESPSIESVWISSDTVWVEVGEMKDLGLCGLCVCPLHLIQTQKIDLPVEFTGEVP